MFKFTILSSFVLFISVKCFSQQQTTEPVKNKSNRIILHFKDTTGLFIKLGKFLIDRGYEIDKTDKELGVLNTKPSKFTGYLFEQDIKSVFRDSTITISGAAYTSGYKFDTYYTAKKRRNIIDLSWQEMIFICEQLKPDYITYSEFK